MKAIADTKPEKTENDYRSDQICEKVVTAVAEAKGVDPLDLEPLYDVVDPDALNNLFRPSSGSSSASVELRFSMADCRVVIQGEGEVTVLSESGNDGKATVDPKRE